MGFFLPRTVFQNFFFFSQWIWCSLSFPHTTPLQINPFSTFLDISNSLSFRKSMFLPHISINSNSHYLQGLWLVLILIYLHPHCNAMMTSSSALMLNPFLMTIEPSTCMFYIQVAVVLNEVLELFITGCIEFTCSSCCFQWPTFQFLKFCFR